MTRLRLTWLPALLLFLNACAGPTYYMQAASGQMTLMRQRADIADLLADGSTDPDLARRLRTAREIRAFGIGELDLPDSGSYTQYAATGREAASWNVVAAPEFSLEPKTWCFLVAGCVPYRGYFEEEDAGKFAGRMENKGYDVYVAPAVAYSTLGWFDDPLLDTMFDYSDAELAGLVFHEMAHQKLYVKGDTVFNESFATFVEETGVRLWLASRGDDSPYQDWMRARKRSREIDELVLSHRQELGELYGSGLAQDRMRSEKQRILDRLCGSLRDYSATSSGEGTGGCDINNASLALRQSYRGGTCAFESLFRDAGADMARFHGLARQKAGLSSTDRRAWLERPCAPVAPKGNL